MEASKSFYVINGNHNSNGMEPFNVIPYLLCRYEESKDKPVNFEEFKGFIEKESMYQWWSRCQYEIILSDWPCKHHEEKWDVHKQVMMNIDTITNILMNEVARNEMEITTV
jgi:hypothetical protein|nr:MAG TPA: Astrotactin-2 domain protein [Caudoviricetes sp.]